MTKSHQQAYVIEFCSHGIAILKFRRDPLNSWGDGIGASSRLLRNFNECLISSGRLKRNRQEFSLSIPKASQ